MKSRVQSLWDNLRSSFWFVPTLMALGAMLLAQGALWVDRRGGESTAAYLYGGGVEGSRSMLSAIASSVLGLAGVTFSITIAALSLASSQFGPRLLRSFIRDRGNQAVLGALIGTFLYCLLVLRSVRDVDEARFVPHAAVTLAIALAIVCLGALIYFIHHISQSIQAAYVIAGVVEEFDEVAGRLFPEEIGHSPEEVGGTDEASALATLPPSFEAEALPIEARRSGYVQSVDADGLMALARERGLVFKLAFRPGDMVMEGDVLALAWPPQASRGDGDSEGRGIEAKVDGFFSLGVQRSTVQDVLFPLDQLAEIGARALSPGTNDPFTAMSCVDALGLALSKLARRRLPSGVRLDDDGSLRVLARGVSFEDAAAVAFGLAIHHGSDSGLVTNRILLILERLAPHMRRQQDRATLRLHAERCIVAAREGLTLQHEREAAEERYAAAARALSAWREPNTEAPRAEAE